MAVYYKGQRADVIDKYFAPFVTSEAFTIRQTANGLTVVDPSPAVVEMIKGKTVKSENLIPFPYYSTFTERYGVQITIQEDGGIYLKGTATADMYFNLCKKAWNMNSFNMNYATTSFTLNGFCASKSGTASTQVGMGYDDRNSMTFIVVYGGGTVDGVVYPMLNEGTTAKPYSKYFSGLKHANFKAIKSTGKNVLKVKDYTNTYGGVTVSVKDNKFTATGTATGAIELWLPLETTLQAGTYSSIIGTEQKLFGTGVQSLSLSPKDRDFDNRKGIANINYPVQNATVNFVSNYMAIYIAKGNEVNCSLDLMLNIGSTAQPVEPYKVEEYTDGNTYGLAEYDYINPQTGELVTQTGYATSETGFTAEELANYNEPIVSADNLSLVYKWDEPRITKLDYPKEYTANNGGLETIEQGETDNSGDGAIPVPTIRYKEAIGIKWHTLIG